MALRAAELELLFTANATQVDQAEKKVQATGKKIESKPITAKVDADEKGALAGMDRVEQAAKKLVSADTAINLDVKIAGAERNLDKTKQKLEELEALALGGLDVTADVRRAEASLSKFERQLSGLTNARQMIEVDANTEPSEAALKRLRRVSGEAGAEAGDEAGEEFGSNIVAALVSIPIAGAVIGIGVAAGKALIEGLNDGLQQEVRYDRLQALTGISEADALRLGRAAGEAYTNNFGASIEANMDTARLALQFNLIDEESTTRSAQKVVQGLAGIADVLGEDVRPVATAVTTLLSSGVAKSADEAFDLLAAGAREGVNRSEDLLDTMTEYPVVLRRLGLSGEEMLGLLNQGLKAGARNSDVAADALKEFQIKATDASDLSAEGFRALGLDAEEMSAKIARGGEGAREGLEQVLTALGEMEPSVERNNAAIALFGTKAEDLGDALYAMDLSSAVDELDGVTGAAQRMFDTLADNDATKLEGAQRNIEVAADGIKGALAQAFSEPLGELADFVSENRGPVLQFLLDMANGAIDFGISMVNAVADSTVATGEFISGPGADMVEMILELQRRIQPFGDHSALEGLVDGMREFDDTTAAAADTMRRQLIEQGLEPAQDRMNEFLEAEVAMGFLNDATRRLAGSLDQVGYAADGATQLVDAYTVAEDGAVRASGELEQQIRDAIVALQDEQVAASEAGEGQEALAERYDAGTEALVGQMVQMGLTEDQARDLINTVLETPASATTEFESNAPEREAEVLALSDRIRTLPDGTVEIVSNTREAQREIDRFVLANDGRIISMTARVSGSGGNTGGGGGGVRNGGIVDFMAAGGIRDLFTPMSPVAQMVPPNTWRVVGDRMDVSEAYIPIDGSTRSMSILLEAMRRMGVTAMANGGMTGSEPRVALASPRGRGMDEATMDRFADKLARKIGESVVSGTRAAAWSGRADA